MKATHVDLWFSKIGAVVFVVASFILNAALKWEIDYKAIIAVGLFIFVVGLPISLSFWLQGIEAIVKAKTGVQLPGTPADSTAGAAKADPLQDQVG